MAFEFQAHAFANIAADGTIATKARRGITSVAHVAASGNYVVTCDDKFDADEAIALVSLRDTGGGSRTSFALISADGEVTVATKTAGVDADNAFTLCVLKIPGVTS